MPDHHRYKDFSLKSIREQIFQVCEVVFYKDVILNLREINLVT